ncbi:hypothetical protein [Streptomyces triticirhizae]|uniref:Uncharacterized protein n=1 Tax=Streptomyces triticirhizae TaxID=2483353 RepID=A0A3M2LWP7_9ACTN|nr:hypothetical protein [Streptomyces triticirhizae]RMI41340.1 hypothetical protein EBN88_11105 [Streptomyces triticirhizae]
MSDATDISMAKPTTRWLASFEHPEEFWHALEMAEEDAAEQVAQAVADRGGEYSQDYAEAVYPEIKAIWEGALEREASPVAVYVPPEPLNSRPLVPVTAFCAPVPTPPAGSTVQTMAQLAAQPQPYRYREPGISVVELPAGPACRVHELILNEPGDDGRRVMVEYVSYYVVPPGYDRGFVELTVTWPSPTLGVEMVETADDIANTLVVSPQ